MKQLLLLSLILLAVPVFAQNWGRNTESAFVNEALDVEVDANGNTYTTGYITGETAFDVTVVQPSAAGNGDIYVAKYAPNGTLIWIQQFGGNFSDRAYDLCIDQADNICVTGQFFGTVNFGATSLTSTSNSKDIFLMKLSPIGNVLWARKEGGSGSENAYGVTTDDANNVILTGQFEGTSSIAGQTFTSIIDPSLNLPSYDLFISKYDSNGNPMWVHHGAAEYEDRGLAVHTDANNNIFMTGQFSDTLIFAGQTFNNNGYNVGFLAKFNPAGQLQWLNTLRAGLVLAYDLEVNNLNEVVVIGDFLGTLQYTDAGGNHTVANPFTKQIFAIKVDNNGIYQWHQSLGSDNSVSARSLAVDTAKDIYITGYFSCGFSELQSTQSAIFNSVGYKDAYLWKIANNGTSQFVKQFGGKKNDIGHGVAIRNSIDPIVCGSYTNDLNVPKNMFSTYLIPYNYFGFSDFWSSEYVFLQGDESQNSFVTNAVHSLTPTYNFFQGQPNDSLYGNIIPDVDTVHYCEQGDIAYSTHTYYHYGPAYSYLWNTGVITSDISIATSGTYSVEVSRADGCSQGADTIHVIIHQLPVLPTMTDNLGLAVNASGPTYYNYVLCSPDSVQTWFNNLDTSYTFSVGNYTDTLPHYYTQGSNSLVTVSDAWCTNQGSFTITYEYPNQPEIEPYIMMQNNGIYTDSITICLGDEVRFDLLDSLENPTAIYGQYPSDTLVQVNWTASPNMGGAENAYTFETNPTTTGWYTISYFGIFGYDNACGLDTIHRNATDSFYIEVLPLPSATTTISGDNLICPGGSVYLTLSNTIPGLGWSGAGISWISAAGDSIQVSAAGTYSYNGTLVDTINGCTSNLSFSHYLAEKLPPVINNYPSDAVICPYDSVHMSVQDIYTSYSWTGPMGTGISTTFEHWDDEQGFYYVNVTDVDGCALTSAPIEIKEYSSPFLVAEPTNVICSGEYINLIAIFDGNGTANWTQPIVSTSSQISVNQPGWYFCELVQCGITVYDSIEVIDGSFSANLAVSDTLLCYGDSAIISAPIGLSSYEWSNGFSGVSFIDVNTAGDYFATVMNSYGCTNQTDTVTITYVSGSEPPVISNLTACLGDDVIVQNLVPLQTDWFTADTVFLSAGFQYLITNISASTTLLASYGAFGSCPASYDEVIVSVIDSVPNYSIAGTSAICPESDAYFSLATNGETVEWMLNNVQVGSGNSISFGAGTLADGDVLSAQISNTCFSNSASVVITVFPSPIADLGATILTVCYDGSVLLELPQAYPSVNWSGDFGSSTTAQFDLQNIVSSGDVYVSVTDLNGCVSAIDTVFIAVSQGWVSIENALGTVCAGDSIYWSATSNLDSIVWSTPSGTVLDSVFSILANSSTAGTYTVVAYDTLGCVYSDSMDLIVNAVPSFVIPEDTIVCLNTYLNFASFPDSNSYTWNGNSALDSMAVGSNQWLIVEATSPAGCTFTDSVFIETVDCQASLTNVFTPNGDGINDYFVLSLVPIYPNNSLTIVNRWGDIIYDVDRYDNSFNGEGLSDGTYFYHFYPHGRSEPESVIPGNVTIFHN